jgi:hypothetical protein
MLVALVKGSKMLSPDSRALYIASAILFLLPWSLLFGSWLTFHRAKVAGPLPAWRRFLVYAGLLVAFVSTALNMLWNASWLQSGGSPHGMGAGPGLWQSLGRFLLWSFAAGTFLSFFGKGKARVLMVGWSISMWVVFQLIYMLQFD